MTIIRARNLCKEWNGVPLFQKVSFEIRAGERLLLFGRNGTGKTTLLKGLAGRLAFEEGDVNCSLQPEEWGLLDQQLEIPAEMGALAYVLSGIEGLPRLKQRLEQLGLLLREDRRNKAFLAEYAVVYERYLQLDGYGWEAAAERCLKQLRLAPEVWDLPYRALSGGQKTRVQLAALLLRQPKLLMLDEPTNHLDKETMEWLEEWVRDYPGTILYVSHDRAFIDRTAMAILELNPDGCRRYPGGYTRYQEQKELEARTLEAQYRSQVQEKQRLQESIRRYAEWFQQAHRAAGQHDFLRAKAKKNVSRLHAKEAALERLEQNRVELPREAASLRMKLAGGEFAAHTLLSLSGVSFGYAGQSAPLLADFNLALRRGDRLAVLGPSGVGKSTLLKLLAGLHPPVEGEVRVHPQTRIGYFAQELEHLDGSVTLLDSLLTLPGMTQSEARNILGCFLFRKDEVFKTIGDLSLGEKCRVAFLRLYFGRFNLLVLDEPTNYLDIDTRERVEEALRDYPGALVVVSHDRYLHDKVANRLLLLAPGHKPRQYEGTYAEYAQQAHAGVPDSAQQARENELGLLQLRLTQLIQSGIARSEEEDRRLMAEVVSLRRQISELTE
ncbi:ribosomal protection-like ABC-F family protein [Paenibacillus donghaensis]|uniref:ABC transporter ATP-binding protein n=1 Tax=Paenibacillus donghaensis TaxID=414771 RepID=A0A2Z2K9D2_9BACL|nr:ABC-F family ATP-binding cassette domain-containing protein [Paenibacillus donghaensis]ASA19430.1 ABC transporter ATP-binding protein [Paenibacillus donghaensis]